MTSDARFLWNIRVPMRDGIELSCDITLPPAPGPYPALLHRTPYDNTNPFFVRQAHFFAEPGYAFVFQDVRGRGDSEGELDTALRLEGKDGYDTIEWIAQQPWCNGKVGTLGGSYAGEIQWHAAREQPPHLVTMVSSAATGRLMEDYPYRFGKFPPYWIWWLHLVSGRTLQDSVSGLGARSPIDFDRIYRTRPLKDADLALGNTRTAWREWLAHNTFDDYWQAASLLGHFHKIDVPVLHITGWYDNAAMGAFFFYENMMAHSPAANRQWLLVGPWDHAGTRNPQRTYGDLDFTEAALLNMDALHLRWFDYWMKDLDNGQADDPPVRVFVMGSNQWHSGPAYPLPGTRTETLYLHGPAEPEKAGRLSNDTPNDVPPTVFVYDPEQPTPSRDPAIDPADRSVHLDNRYAEKRHDVRVFTSAAVEEPWTLMGTSYLVLYASSDCIDTDFMATLCDVHPDGRSITLSTAVLRASYREGSAAPEPIVPGKIYEYRLEFYAAGLTLLPGHRLRISIMSSWYPAYDLNPNTGARQGDDAITQVAHQAIWHERSYSSHLLLPVAPVFA
ncbi:MAG: CocE/NonD family hydrolase [Chloroflexi bacterium]|nr:CocE/NonD family hydrolase [Chloroflexota bacterium]